ILLANSKCDEELAQNLLDHGAKVDQVDNLKRSVFHYAVCNGKQIILKLALAAAYLTGKLAILEKPDSLTYSPLQLAVFYEEYPDILRHMLAMCANVNHS